MSIHGLSICIWKNYGTAASPGAQQVIVSKCQCGFKALNMFPEAELTQNGGFSLWLCGSAKA